MTFYVRIQFPEGIVTWQLESKDQATALEAATNHPSGPNRTHT